MMRLLAFPLIILLAASLSAEEELPQNPSEPEPLEIEPPLLIQEVPSRGPVQSTPRVTPELDPERIQIALEKAKKSAASGERMFRSGIIAKVEAENRALKVVRLTADLANARLELAKKNVATQQSRFDAAEIPEAELEQAKTTLVAATKEAAEATAQRQKAELDAAFVNLQRQKKLLALGSGRKSEVSRAEEKIATLQQQKN
jgi:multidrug resistance efflux pump